jgi:hypothetical protein
MLLPHLVRALPLREPASMARAGATAGLPAPECWCAAMASRLVAPFRTHLCRMSPIVAHRRLFSPCSPARLKIERVAIKRRVLPTPVIRAGRLPA